MQAAFNEIPIAELCTRVTSGSTPLRGRSDYYDGGTIDWFKTGELNDWFVESSAEKVTPVALQDTSLKLFPSETVLMAMYGDGKTITTLSILRKPATTNQACAAMLVDRMKCDPRYFFYALKSRRHLLVGLALGGAQRNLSAKIVKDFHLPVPSLEAQRHIASILSAYDELIENCQRRIRILEDMARGLYREWFVHFRFPGADALLCVDSPLGPIPRGWEVRRLDEVLVLQRGFDLPKSERADGSVPVYAATGITGFHDEAKVHAPGVVTGRSGTIGEVLYVQEDFWPLNTTLWVKAFPRSEPLFAYFLLGSLGLKQFNSGAAVPTLNRNDVHGIPVVVPPRDVQRRFQEITGSMLGQARMLTMKIANLRRTRDLLLPRLLSGQITLASAESDRASSNTASPRAFV